MPRAPPSRRRRLSPRRHGTATCAGPMPFTRGGNSPAMSDTPPQSIARPSSARASRPCTAAHSNRRPTSSWRWGSGSEAVARPSTAARPPIGRGRAPPSERRFQMLDAHQPAGEVKTHPDRVEAQHRRERMAAALAQPAAGHPPHLDSLVRAHGVERRYATWADPPGLHLTEHERAVSKRHDVELSPPRSIVAFENPEAPPDKVLGGQRFADLSQTLAPIAAHSATLRARE